MVTESNRELGYEERLPQRCDERHASHRAAVNHAAERREQLGGSGRKQSRAERVLQAGPPARHCSDGPPGVSYATSKKKVPSLYNAPM